MCTGRTIQSLLLRTSPYRSHLKVTSMRKRTSEPSPNLTFENAKEVWRRYRSGEYQHQIAAFFKVNQGRISEVITGKRHPGSDRLI